MAGWVVPPGYRVYPPRMNLAYEVLDRHLEEGRGDRLALRAAGGDWTYARLQEEVCRAAAGLRELGLGKGDTLLLRSRNSPEVCVLVLAACRIGAVAVPTHTLLRDEELEHILENSEARVAAAPRDLAGPLQLFLAAGRLKRLIVLGGDTAAGGRGEVAYPDLLGGGREVGVADTDAMDPAFILYSSGTTGKAKGVAHAHRWVVTVGDPARLQMEYAADDVVLGAGEYSFMGNFGHGFIFPLYSGSGIAIYDARPSPGPVLGAIERFRVSKFFAVPTFYRSLLAEPGVEAGLDLTAVRFAVSAGEPLGATVYEAWRARFPFPLYDVFGVSEVELLIGNGPANEVLPGSLGRALPGMKIALLDERLEEVLPGRPGRLMIHRSDPGLFIEYRKQWAKWRLAHRGEWYDTGDVMTRDENGYYWYVGRQDDLFKSRGYFVSPQEIENALLRHPVVREAAVVGVPDERLGNRVCAFVVLRTTARPSPALAQEIIDGVKTQVAAFKVPKELEFVDELPKNPVGKILRRALVERKVAPGRP